MQEILLQRIKFAKITPYKDYCKIDEKSKLTTSTNRHEMSGLFDDFRKNGKVIRATEHKKRGKIFYFSTKDGVENTFVVDNAYVNPETYNSFETKKDYQIKRHYGRPFTQIELYILERQIKIENDKLIIRLYSNIKTRGVNCIYFKKSYSVTSISFNLTNGNFTITKISKSGKSSTKHFRKNSFNELYNVLVNSGIINYRIPLSNKKSELYKECEKIFDNKIFIEKLREKLDVSYDVTLNHEISKVIFSDYTKYFIKLKKIKVPNGEYTYWLKNFYPTEKYLKKNDRKLIASILDMIDLKSKITIKILHEYSNIDLVNFKWLCEFFGDDYQKYISNINPRIFEDDNKKNKVEGNNKFLISNRFNRPIHRHTLSENDKEILIKIINSTNYKHDDIISSRFVSLIDDHFSMIEKLKDYIPEIQMKAKNYDDFIMEHNQFSKMVSLIKKGWVNEYKFTNKLINEIEKPIEVKLNLGTKEHPVWSSDVGEVKYLYPYILKRDDDYEEEGKFMHHCVGTYSDKEKSIIISIRTENASNRVTCEYDIQSGRCIQQRHFCNGEPPKEFEYVLEVVKEIVKRHSNYGTLNWTERNRVPVKINGIEIKPEDREPRRLNDIFDDLYF